MDIESDFESLDSLEDIEAAIRNEVNDEDLAYEFANLVNSDYGVLPKAELIREFLDYLDEDSVSVLEVELGFVV